MQGCRRRRSNRHDRSGINGGNVERDCAARFGESVLGAGGGAEGGRVDGGAEGGQEQEGGWVGWAVAPQEETGGR